MEKSIYGFMFKVSIDDTMERIAEFKSTSEENAYKNFKKWCKKNGLFEGEALGKMMTNKVTTVMELERV